MKITLIELDLQYSTVTYQLVLTSIIRRVYRQTLSRVRVRTDIDSSIIISLQWKKGT